MEFTAPPASVRLVACGPSRPVLSVSVPVQLPRNPDGTASSDDPPEEAATADAETEAETLAVVWPVGPELVDTPSVPELLEAPDCSIVVMITAATAAAATAPEPARTAVRRRTAGRRVAPPSGYHGPPGRV